jgi:hypothetical protein
MIKLLQFLVGLVASLLDKAFQMDQAYSGRHGPEAAMHHDQSEALANCAAAHRRQAE